MYRLYDSTSLTYFEIEHEQWNQHMHWALVHVGVFNRRGQWKCMICSAHGPSKAIWNKHKIVFRDVWWHRVLCPMPIFQDLVIFVSMTITTMTTTTSTTELITLPLVGYWVIRTYSSSEYIVHIQIHFCIVSTSSEAGWCVSSCIHVCIELNGTEGVVTRTSTQTNVVGIVTLRNVCTNIYKVEPLYKDTPEMRTPPLIRTLCMVPAT